jgi:hypothetical protein
MSTGFFNKLANVANALGLAWWVEVTTASPPCTYYFGPFWSSDEADDARGGYVEDLEQEGAQGIFATVKRCKPEALTIYEDEAAPQGSPSFSGQI